MQKKHYPSGVIYNSNSVNCSMIPKSDSHVHTSWTDGQGSVHEVHSAALAANLQTLVFSEHSRKTSTDWFYKFADEVRSLPQDLCSSFVGTEVKVQDLSGQIDTTSEISSQCDFIMASVHRFVDEYGNSMNFAQVNPAQALQIELKMTLAALENPLVDILGHMFGMSIRRFSRIPSQEMILEVIEKAVRHGVTIEINSYYQQNCLLLLDLCKKCNANISFGSNAHKLTEVGSITRQLEAEFRNA